MYYGIIVAVGIRGSKMKKLMVAMVAALLMSGAVIAEDNANSSKEATSAVEKKVDFKFKIVANYGKYPEMAAWIWSVQALCEKYYPILIKELDSEGYKPYDKVFLSVKSDPRGVAGTGGNRIGFSKEYFIRHGSDMGAAIHELVHVIQAYPEYIPWITEGIADYIRYYKFEPKELRIVPNPEKAKLSDGYKTVAAFFDWIVREKDEKFIQKMNALLRQGKYTDEKFKESTGKLPQELFDEYLETLKK